MTPEEMISEFQCPGCTCGSSPCGTCDKFKMNTTYGHSCENHSAGTFIMGLGRIALGLPKGFTRMPPGERPRDLGITLAIRNWTEGTHPEWDHLNVPVWAMEKDGLLFVRTFVPRLASQYIDVVEKGTLELVPQAIDVSEFIDEID